jgi:uncharacterized protein YkwD
MTAIAASHRGPLRTVLTALIVVLALCAPMLVGTVSAEAKRRRTMTTTEKSYSTAVLSQLNAERRAHHLKPLKVSTRLISSARTHNLDMAAKNTMSHQLRGEKSFDRRISATGYDWSWVGENIGWNSNISKAGVKYLETIMYKEKAPNDGHRRNILNKHYTNVGIDIYIDNVHHKVWLTQDFGRPY